MARFFIDRPIFAWVISIVIMLAGLAALVFLPVAQYPEITPPTVQVTCQYPGASAEVVADTVAAPIEQQVNGVEDMLYMSSQSTNDGSYNLTVTFELGTNLDMAQVLVQNRVQQAIPTLPDVVKATGVTVKKRSPSILLVVNLYSPLDAQTKQPTYDQLFLSNYATINIKDELARIDGVGDVSLFGQQDYSMRVWLDPNRLAARNLTAGDVVDALREQNVQVAAGQIGQPPVPSGVDFQYTMTTLGRLTDADQFASIVVKTGEDGEITRLEDVAEAERGAKDQNTQCLLDGRPSVGLAIYQRPGSNALATADRVRERMEQLKTDFDRGIDYAIVYDTTPFVEESVDEVFHTLRDAVILVAIVILLFLQDWRSVILPLIDIGVSLVGTLAIMYAFGFTVNNLTLFGLVLAIGIVVDDAIVVLENIERWLAKGLAVREATIGAMHEITGPIIAMTLVMCAVFLPSALIPGISGQFYRQFALTIAAAMLLSATNAMTMTPARAAAIFKNRTVSKEGHLEGAEALPWWGSALALGWVSALLLTPLASLVGLDAGGSSWRAWAVFAALMLPGAIVGSLISGIVNQLLGWFFKGFNWGFERVTRAYGAGVGWLLRLSVIVLLVYGGLAGLTYYGLTRVPAGFIPNQDKGYLLVNMQLPDSSSLERTVEVAEKVEKIAHEIDGIAHTVSVPGQSFVLNAISSNFASMFVILEPFQDRHASRLAADAIAQRLRRRLYDEVLEAQIAVFGAPPVDGLGNSGGFKMMVEDRGNRVGLDVLAGQADALAEQANRQPGLVGVINTFRADTPQLYVDVDRTKCKMMGVPLSDVFNTLQYYLGGYYVNDFNEFGRTWQVNVQAAAPYRLTVEGVKQLKVRSKDGDMVPLGTIADVRDSTGPVLLTRYNMHTSAAINGSWLPGTSSGQVIQTMETLAAELLPQSMGFEWTELTYLQLLAAGTAAFAFAGAVVLVFLVLAAQYESWSMPMAVILVVPMCLLCSVAGVAMAGMDINIFVQVGFVVLVGLASKNAILVVEFARELQRTEGLAPFDATIAASRTRLRPIVMTSFAFILGVAPLVIASGAGAEMRQTLGTAVFSGMLGVTGFGLVLTPVFYYVIERIFRRKPAARAKRPSKDTPPAPSPDGHQAADGGQKLADASKTA